MHKVKHFSFKTSEPETVSLNIYSTLTPEMETFEKLSKFKYEDFQFRWSCLVFIINLYNFFSVGFFLGMMSSPGDVWLGLEIITECIIIVDFLLRVFLTRSSKTNQMWFMHESASLKVWTCLVLSSVPYSSLFTFAGASDSTALVVWRVAKLFRVLQLAKFSKNLAMVIRESQLKALEIFKAILAISVVSHYTAMLYLLILRQSHELKEKKSFALYIDSVLWAQETLTGIVQSESSIRKQNIEIFTIVVMSVGVVLYGSLFLKFFTFLQDLHKEETLFQSQKKSIETWCKSRKISQNMQERIASYFQISRNSWIPDPYPADLPLSLLSELAIFQYRDLVSKVKLFELGEPSFVMSMVRAFVQEIFLQGDFVIRYGDLATQMYFVKTGMVEVLATDGLSRIALLEDGEYFGEIGILLKTCRTVSVKAVVPSVLARISKDSLLKILENFEEHKEFLISVAKQRLKTCRKEDIDLKYDLVEDNYSSSDSDESGELQCPAYYAPAEHGLKKWWLRLITVPNSKTQKGIVQFEPLSPFFYVWSGLMLVCFSVYVFIIPYSVSFQTPESLVVLDGLCYAVFLADVYVNYYSALLTEFKVYVHDRAEIHRNYMNCFFAFDALAVLPADWVYCAFECRTVSNFLLKTLRFFKIVRVVSLLKVINAHSEISQKLMKISVYIFSFCAVGHISACFLDRIETEHGSSEYIENLYWTFSVFSLSSYGDIAAESLASKIVLIFFMVSAKLFYVIIFAECVIFIKEKHEIFISFIKKIKSLQEWVEHSTLSAELKTKINDFYLLKWNHLKGVEDNYVLSKLPESLSTDLRLELFRGLIESKFFPSEEIGAILGVIRKCKIKTVSKGINVVNRGEIGLEMFFVLEGSFSVYSEDNSFIKQLNTGSIFGELAILEDQPGLRAATVTALADSSLASLSAEDFREISRSYPDFRDKVKKYSKDRSLDSLVEPVHLTSQVNEDDSFDNKSQINGKNYEKIEEVSFERTVLSTVYPDIKEKSNQINFRPLILRLFQNSIKDWIYFGVLFWNLIFIPLQVAFEIRYISLLILIEILVVIFYIIMSLCNLFMMNYKELDSKNSYIFNCIFYLIIAVPVAMIVDMIGLKGSKALIVVFSYIRLLNFSFIFSFFHELKEKKIFWYLTIQLVEIITVTFLCSHVVACLFITIANGKKDSWIEFVLDDSDTTVYITAFYWAFGTLIHMLQGDVLSISDDEKLFTCFVQIFSVFFFAFMYGGLIEITSILGSKLREKFYNDYLFVMKFIEKKKIMKYKTSLNDYFNFIWKSQKGIFDNSVIEGLPESLKVEIFLGKYRDVLKSSRMFNFCQSFDISLLRSICRLIKFRYCIIGDVILRVGDVSDDMFFILEGEVTVVSIQGDTVLGVLGPGSHFGEVTVLFNTPIKTATVVATKFTFLFIISGHDLEMLFRAFPDWKEEMINFSQERLIRTFGAKNLYEVSQICESISKVMTTDFQLSRQYTLQSDMLISHKIADAKALLFHDTRFSLNLLHLVLIIYSCFVIPFELSFLGNYPYWVLALEVFCFVESCVYLFIRMQKELKLKMSDLWAYRNAIIFDLLALSPFNFILPLAGIKSPRGLISFIKSIRLFSVFRIHSLLSTLMVYNKKFFLGLTVFETSLYLFIFINWVTCILHFNFSCDGSEDYLSSLYFTMNIITFTGHTDAFPCSRTLIIQVCLVGFISASSLSLFLGLLSLIFSRSQQTEHQIFLNLIQKFKKTLKENPPKSLQYRIECYCKFSAALHFNYDETIAKEVFLHLPRNLVNDLLYEKSRHMLKKVPFLKESGSDVLLKRIALKLQAEIYLPQDYLIYKDDMGEEMYFIGIGSVNIISPDNSKIIKSLFQGDFFGEMALINNSRRMCSVVANTLCLVHSLLKQDFNEILQNLPEVLAKLKKQSEIRSRETTSVSQSAFLNFTEDEEQRKLFNHLKMYSLVSSYYNDHNKTRENSSLLAGMKNIKSATAIESFAKDRSSYKIYKRRPDMQRAGERRNSQVSFGKKLVFDRFSKLKVKWAGNEEIKH